MSQIALNRAGIDTIVGQLIAAGVTQHARVDLHVEARSRGRALHHRLEASRRKRCPALAQKDEERSRRLPFKSAQGAQFTPPQGVRCRCAPAPQNQTSVERIRMSTKCQEADIAHSNQSK